MSLELKNIEKKVGIDTHIHPTSLKLEKNMVLPQVKKIIWDCPPISNIINHDEWPYFLKVLLCGYII